MFIADYMPLLIFIVLAVGAGAVMVGLGTFIGPSNPTKQKQIPFEAGSDPVGTPKESRFSVKFYMVALSFILFDLEAVFVIPWTVAWKQNDALGYGIYSLGVMLVFVAILTLGLVYEWSQGGLEWE